MGRTSNLLLQSGSPRNDLNPCTRLLARHAFEEEIVMMWMLLTKTT